MSSLGRVLLVVGVLVAVVGGLMAAGVRPPLGRLPGDISGSRGSFSWSIPLGTSLVLSALLTVILNVLLRR